MNWLTQQLNRQLIAAALLFWIPLVIVIAIAQEVTESEPLFFDEPILNALRSATSPGLDSIMTALTQFGGIVGVGVATAALVYYCFRYVGRRATLLVVAVAGGAAIANVGLKLLFERARPDLWQPIISESSYSFPSGHAMGSSALALSIILVLWHTKWRNLALVGGAIYVIIIGFSRVYLGVHYPSDILAGWGISLLWAMIVYRFLYGFKKPAPSH